MKALLLASLLWAMTAAAEGPTTYVWQVTCPAVDSRLTAGPYSTPDQCREARMQTVAACERPLLGPNQPNPDFVRVADVCKEAHDAHDCECEYVAVQARRPFRSVLDVIREVQAAEAARTGQIQVRP